MASAHEEKMRDEQREQKYIENEEIGMAAAHGNVEGAKKAVFKMDVRYVFVSVVALKALS